MVPEILLWNALHPIDFDLDVTSVGQRVGHLVDSVFMDLHAMDRETRSRVQFLVADVALKVLGLLVLDEDFLVIKLSVAVP